MEPITNEVTEVKGEFNHPNTNLISHRMSQVTDNSEAQPQISTYATISKLIWSGFGCASPMALPHSNMYNANDGSPKRIRPV